MDRLLIGDLTNLYFIDINLNKINKSELPESIKKKT